MRSRGGFTLVEMLLVVVLTGVTLGAVYQTLFVQEQSYRAGGAIIRGQDALRTAIGILESELREVSTMGSTIGGADIRIATADSVVFRAQRKVAFACDLSRNDKWLVVASHGDRFAAGDSLLLFMDGDSLSYKDDRWSPALVTNATATTNAECTTRFPGAPIQLLKIAADTLTGLRRWAPVRSFEWVTYGIYEFDDTGWSLGRHRSGEPATYLVGGLAPRGQGLRFGYYDSAGAVATAVGDIARIRVDVMTDPNAPGVQPASMGTNLYLRNN